MAKTEADVWALYRRLLEFAQRGLKFSPDDAHDAASFAIARAIELDYWDIPYLFTTMKNFHFGDKFKRNKVALAGVDADDFGAVPNLFELPRQQIRMELIGCLDAIGTLSEQARRAILMAASEYDTAEIARAMGLRIGRVQQIIGEVRKILRMRSLYELSKSKKGHHRFLGVSKEGRKWRADINDGEGRRYIGLFETASEAAKAYDIEAKKLSKALLNFDQLPAVD